MDNEAGFKFDERQTLLRYKITSICALFALAVITSNCLAMERFGMWATYSGATIMFAMIALAIIEIVETCKGCVADIHGKTSELTKIPLCIVLCLTIMQWSGYKFFDNGIMTTGLCALIGFGALILSILFSFIFTKLTFRK